MSKQRSKRKRPPNKSVKNRKVRVARKREALNAYGERQREIAVGTKQFWSDAKQ